MKEIDSFGISQEAKTDLINIVQIKTRSWNDISFQSWTKIKTHEIFWMKVISSEEWDLF
jgi:hypothetical protein